MNDNDLIRRGDAVLAVTAADKECLGANGAREFIRALAAAPTFTDAEAIAAWNTRTPEPAVQALVEARAAWEAFKYATSSADHFDAVERLDAALAAFDKTD